LSSFSCPFFERTRKRREEKKKKSISRREREKEKGRGEESLFDISDPLSLVKQENVMEKKQKKKDDSFSPLKKNLVLRPFVPQNLPKKMKKEKKEEEKGEMGGGGEERIS
jgi:hypothetical protein